MLLIQGYFFCSQRICCFSGFKRWCRSHMPSGI